MQNVEWGKGESDYLRKAPGFKLKAKSLMLKTKKKCIALQAKYL
jgi:hypothetical protein